MDTSTSMEDILMRSRTTILDILEQRRGYNTTPYRKLNGPDLVKLIGNPPSLRMTLKKKDDPTKLCIIEYEFGNIKQSVGNGSLINNLLMEPQGPDAPDTLRNVNPETTEVIIMYMPKNIYEDTESYDSAALNAFNTKGFCIQFFPMPRLVNNPLDHVLQPIFEVVPKEEHSTILKEWHCRTKAQFPLIRFHHDMVARCLGLVPGDIVKITRDSPSAGKYVLYRTCAP